MRPFVRLSCVLLSLILIPSVVFAQASITGVVRDSSGAVLPGVTVEASSPALIEKVRSTFTDTTGQYRIEDLRPGSYVVTFSLPGFSTVKREGIELTGTFAATVNVDLKVGAVSETITVTGESPVVDIVNARRQSTVSNETIAAIPTARLYHSLVTTSSTSSGMSNGSARRARAAATPRRRRKRAATTMRRHACSR